MNLTLQLKSISHFIRTVFKYVLHQKPGIRNPIDNYVEFMRGKHSNKGEIIKKDKYTRERERERAREREREREEASVNRQAHKI